MSGTARVAPTAGIATPESLIEEADGQRDEQRDEPGAQRRRLVVGALHRPRPPRGGPGQHVDDEEQGGRHEQGQRGVAEQDVDVLLALADDDVEGVAVDDRLHEAAQVAARRRRRAASRRRPRGRTAPTTPTASRSSALPGQLQPEHREHEVGQPGHEGRRAAAVGAPERHRVDDDREPADQRPPRARPPSADRPARASTRPRCTAGSWPSRTARRSGCPCRSSGRRRPAAGPSATTAAGATRSSRRRRARPSSWPTRTPSARAPTCPTARASAAVAMIATNSPTAATTEIIVDREAPPRQQVGQEGRHRHGCRGHRQHAHPRERGHPGALGAQPALVDEQHEQVDRPAGRRRRR